MSVERQVPTDSTVNLTERGRKIRLPERQPASGRYSTPGYAGRDPPQLRRLHFANGKIAKRAMNSSRRGENIRPSGDVAQRR